MRPPRHHSTGNHPHTSAERRNRTTSPFAFESVAAFELRIEAVVPFISSTRSTRLRLNGS